jgi:hypothetical protein
MNNKLLDEYDELLKSKINSKDWSDDIGFVLCELDKTQVTLYKQKCEQTVPRNGDIVVGFYLDEKSEQSLTINITIGGVICPSLTLLPGEFKYFFENTYFPIIAIHSSETHIETEDYSNLFIIYGFAQTLLRKYLVQNTYNLNLNNKKAVIRDGYFGYL